MRLCQRVALRSRSLAEDVRVRVAVPAHHSDTLMNAPPVPPDDEEFMELLREASVVSDSGDYFHPNTMVSFVYEGIDNSGIVRRATVYYDRLIAEGSPLVKRTTVPDVTHGGPTGLYNVPAGASQVRDILLSACRVW